MNEQRKNLINKIYKALQNQEITIGNKLLSERVLADKFSVKRPVLRDALIALEALGVVDIRDRQGTYLAEATMSNMTEGLEQIASTPVDILSQVFELRIILEVPMAELAAQRRTNHDMILLKNEMEFLENLDASNSCNKGELGSLHNNILHNIIASSTHNRVLLRIFEGLTKVSQNSIAAMGNNGIAFNPFTTWPKILLQEHWNIVNAIISGDSDLAKKNMICHLKNSKKRNQTMQN